MKKKFVKVEVRTTQNDLLAVFPKVRGKRNYVEEFHMALIADGMGGKMLVKEIVVDKPVLIRVVRDITKRGRNTREIVAEIRKDYANRMKRNF